MEFDWIDAHLICTRSRRRKSKNPLKTRSAFACSRKASRTTPKARFFNLGKCVCERGIFSVFWTDGKRYRVILAREMTPEEKTFYERKNTEMSF